jgi:hypothetical protein
MLRRMRGLREAAPKKQWLFERPIHQPDVPPKKYLAMTSTPRYAIQKRRS